jgi:diphosphomevalonate decarboxylase
VTIAVMERVKEIRQSGVPAFFTMDAGPHVKVVTAPQNAEEVATLLARVPGVLEIIRCNAGPDAHVETQGARS